MLVKIFDKSVSAATGTLVDVAPNRPGLVVDRIEYRIKLTLNVTAAGGGTAGLFTMKQQSLFDFWYRNQRSDQARQGTRNVNLAQLGQLATLYLDGALQTSDTQLPDSVSNGGAVAVVERTIIARVPFVPRWVDNPDDYAPDLQDIGFQQFIFSGAPDAIAASAQTITAIEVLGFAVCRQRRTRRVVARRFFQRVPSQLPVLNDRFALRDPVSGQRSRIMAAVIGSTDGTGSPVTNSLNPNIAIDGIPVVDGVRLPNIGSISQTFGDPAYPNSTSQLAYAPTKFAYLLPPAPGGKLSELPAGDELQLTVQSSTVASGTQQVILDSVCPLTDAEALAAVGIQRGADDVQRDGADNAAYSAVAFIPAQPQRTA